VDVRGAVCIQEGGEGLVVEHAGGSGGGSDWGVETFWDLAGYCGTEGERVAWLGKGGRMAYYGIYGVCACAPVVNG
jgi:hypothetical protein